MLKIRRSETPPTAAPAPQLPRALLKVGETYQEAPAEAVRLGIEGAAISKRAAVDELRLKAINKDLKRAADGDDELGKKVARCLKWVNGAVSLNYLAAKELPASTATGGESA